MATATKTGPILGPRRGRGTETGGRDGEGSLRRERGPTGRKLERAVVRHATLKLVATHTATYRQAGRTIGVELEHSLDEELVRLLVARL